MFPLCMSLLCSTFEDACGPHSVKVEFLRDPSDKLRNCVNLTAFGCKCALVYVLCEET